MVKRQREDADHDERPVKQPRKGNSSVDVDLVDIYDQLAHHEQSKRLKAAAGLLQKLQSDSISREQIDKSLRRLFRGLNSGRKAARQGFAVALTEVLSQLVSSKINVSVLTRSVIDIWEECTSPDNGASKQEEREHYLGRIFGADSIINSELLTSRQDRDQWRRLVSKLCEVASKKPWLRQECGWLFYQFVQTHAGADLLPYVEDIIESLTSFKIVRSPEGVAVWLAAKKAYPKAKLLKHVWRHGHPLAAKDVKSLADVMKDAKFKASGDETEAQGSAVWNAKLHFAWEVVLHYLFYHEQVVAKPPNSQASGLSGSETVRFGEFWNVVVDEGLFGPTSSVERKQWGLLVWKLALQEATSVIVPYLFSPNTMHFVIKATTTKDSYQGKTIQMALKELQQRLESSGAREPMVVDSAACTAAILKASKYADIDSLIKFPLLMFLTTKGKVSSRNRCLDVVRTLYIENEGNIQRLKYLVDLQSKIVGSLVHTVSEESDKVASNHIAFWFETLHCSKDLDEELATRIQDRIEASFDAYLRRSLGGAQAVRSCVSTAIMKQMEIEKIKCDEDVKALIATAWSRAENLNLRIGDPGMKMMSEDEALLLLLCISILGVVNGEPDASDVLRDLVSISESRQPTGVADSLMEILLSLAPRPSKFLRSANQQVFQSIAPSITHDGLESLTRVLLAKENKQGQHELLESDGGDDLSDDLSDTRMNEDLDSDVEVSDFRDEEDPNDSISKSTSQTSEEESQNGASAETRDEEEELVAFDAALASALGNGRLEESDNPLDDDTNDSDMDDDEMMELDDKLAEVFKARLAANDQKKQQKQTNEAFIAFKNRVLDLIELYLKHQTSNALTLNLVLPLIQSMRLTRTKQLSERIYNILKEFCSRAKTSYLPKIDQDQAKDTLAHLVQIHNEACLNSSNAHASIASSVSILVVKVLLNAGTSIGAIVDVYSNTRKRQLTEKSCKVRPAFFTDWNNWCSTARDQLAK